MKILFPILITIIAGLVAPSAVALVGFLMFGNLLRECGVLERLSKSAQNELANLVTILLGLSIASTMTADKFLQPQTLLILGLGLIAFVFDTAGGVIFAKILNQSYGRCCGHFSISNVSTCYTKNGSKRRPSKLFINGSNKCKCCRANRLCDSWWLDISLD